MNSLSKKNQQRKQSEKQSTGLIFFSFVYKLFRGIITVAMYIITWFFCLLALATLFGIVGGLIAQDLEDIEAYIFSVFFFIAIVFVLWLINRKIVGNVVKYFIFGGWGLPQGYLFLSMLVCLVIVGIFNGFTEELNGWVFWIGIITGLVVTYYPFKKFTIWFYEREEQKEQKENKMNDQKIRKKKGKDKNQKNHPKKRGAV